jgi:uncharacterized HAD superfamily protein
MRSAAVFDLDGTLADDSHRKSFVSGEVKYFQKYYSLMDQDPRKGEIAEVLWLCKKQGLAIIIVTGRPERYRDTTVKWLAENKIEYDLLEMRGDSDFRKAAVMKLEVLEKRINPFYKVRIAFDDNSEIINMFRLNGVEAVRVV